MSGRLAGRVCVVTGASKGIGRAVALAMLAEGAQVIGIARNPVEGLGFPLELADVSDRPAVERVVGHVLHAFGRVDVLVNNAGIAPLGTIENTSEEDWERVFAINVKTMYLVSAAVIGGMKERRMGSIINMSSNYGLVGGLNCAAYCATKGAIISLTRAMALDYAPFGIRVNCICPGTIDTPIIREPMRSMTAEEVEAKMKDRYSRHPLGRIGQPEEVAPGVIYLASDESSFVTGSILTIDGGYTAR
ncbi:MAG: SDR family NAD(P)-dependent oxidoreductase [Anaerolineae bacterium]